MLETLPVGPILVESSPWVLLAMVGYLIVRGHLATPREVRRLEEEIKYLRETVRISEAARSEALTQNSQMIGTLDTIEGIVRAIPTAPHRRR